MNNLDQDTVDGFGDEWSTFSHQGFDLETLREQFNRYFALFNWHSLPNNAIGFDLGCGTGRWAGFVASKVGKLHCIDASEKALNVARENLCSLKNCEFHCASVESIPLEDDSMDFGYSLGVLHHVPDTQAGINSCIKKLKTGAPFLIYLYYAFDNKPAWFRFIWKCSDTLRRVISSMPFKPRLYICQIIAVIIYLPTAKLTLLIEKLGFNVENIPLSAYRSLPFYTMRTDALDRFGTKLEQRFNKDEIKSMLATAGLERIAFHDDIPFWCALGYKK